MATMPDLDAATYAKLSGGTAITSLLGGTVAPNPKIYESQAPANTALPYLLFYYPSELNMNVTPRDTTNAVCRIEAIAASRASAKTIIQAVYSVVHNSNLTVTGWSNFVLRWEGNTRLPVENIDGKQHHRMVSEYRVQLARDS